MKNLEFKRLTRAFLVTILVSTISLVHISAWVYQDWMPSDTKFEKFGPRADRLYLWFNSPYEYLENGLIDILDLPLTDYWYTRWTNPPFNETINVVGYISTFLIILDINNANTSTSPVYPNPCSVVGFRQAIAHLVDRTWFDEIIGPGRYVPIWVPMSPALGKYYLDIPNPYPFNLVIASILLDHNWFPLNPVTGWRFWDRNHNGIEEPEEFLELKFVIRVDHLHRKQIGDKIADKLELVQIRVNRIYADRARVYKIVMVERDFHLYTGVFEHGDDPTFLYDFHSSTNNYNGINDTELDFWLDALLNAQTQDEAVEASHNAQQVFVNKSFKVPLCVYVNYKAMYRRYTGSTACQPVVPDDGENLYRNQSWQGAVNAPGRGIDNLFSFLNMYPTGFAYGDGENMTIRYGFNSPWSLNPIYAFPEEMFVLNLIYEALIKRDPYENGWYPWIAKNFTIGTYRHPLYGNCIKIKVTLRTDITWNDGTPLTTADVYFTFVELKRLLETHGYPPPSWIDNVKDIIDFKILDSYNFEILFNVSKNYWALSCVGNVPILPKHVWKPIIEFGKPGDPRLDPNMIGSGPWRLKEWTRSYILLVANRPCSTVQTNLPGSKPVHSPLGYFQLYPVYVDIHFTAQFEYNHRIPPEVETVFYKVTLENFIREEIIVQGYVDPANPVSSSWNGTWPMDTEYRLVNWIDDNHDKFLSEGDTVVLMPQEEPPVPLEWYNVELLLIMPPGPATMRLSPIITGTKYLYLDNKLIETQNITLKAGASHEQVRIYWPAIGKHTFKVAFHIEEPNWNSWRLQCRWINYSFTFWVTLRQDIVGSSLYDDIGLPTYPYKQQLPSPDIKVDIFDIVYIALAFGSYIGSSDWNPVADINCDYIIDIFDIVLIALEFGWPR